MPILEVVLLVGVISLQAISLHSSLSRRLGLNTEQSTLSNEANLPDLNGPIRKVIPLPTIALADEKISTANNVQASATRGLNLHLTAAQKY